MNIVITYLHKGRDEYLELIKDAFYSAKLYGYKCITVGDTPLGDIHIDFPASKEVHLMNWILAAQKEFIDSEYFDGYSVIFSPDALINKPLESVFTNYFDVAFTDRDNKKYPINNGVIFLKSHNKKGLSSFWARCLEICKGYALDIQDWYGDQLSLWDAYSAKEHEKLGVNVALLPCAIYNASPRKGQIDDNILKEAYIIHLKGARKTMMKLYKERL